LGNSLTLFGIRLITRLDFRARLQFIH
jgi:hypothetical protein